MKKHIKNIALSVLSIVTFTACQSELDNFNDDPNDPPTTTPTLLLTTMEVSTFATHTTGVIRYANIFDQHLMGTDIGQLGPIAKYIITEQDVNNEWNTIYGTTLISGHILNRDFSTDYPYYNGMGQVLTALNLGYATDIWGDVPYDEAFLAEEGNTNPKYNTQQEIYQRLQTILDAAISNLNKPKSDNKEVPGDDDYIFKGDVQKWKQIAYVLKARYALRLTNVDNNAAQKALDYINLAEVTSNSDDMNTLFTGAANETNQWYDFEVNRESYVKMGKTFVDFLKTSNDPRLTFFVASELDEDGEPTGVYSGNAPEDTESTGTSYIGPSMASADSNIGIITYAEAKFIEAEAQFRLNRPVLAQAALNDAIAASILKYTGTSASAIFINTVNTLSLENIIKQKYNSLFLTMEPYNDFRRTGFPTLIANQNSSTKVIPVRIPTPSEERLYNPNATVVSNTSTKVWWDNN